MIPKEKTDPIALVADALPRCALALTRRAARTLTQLYDSYLSESQMEAAQFALMMTLDSAQGKSQTELCRILGMDKTTLSRNLKVLKAKGWVEPVVAKDARQRRMSLSAEGSRRMTAAKPAWRQAQEALRAHMREEEWSGMWATLQAATRAADEALQKFA